MFVLSVIALLASFISAVSAEDTFAPLYTDHGSYVDDANSVVSCNEGGAVASQVYNVVSNSTMFCYSPFPGIILTPVNSTTDWQCPSNAVVTGLRFNVTSWKFVGVKCVSPDQKQYAVAQSYSFSPKTARFDTPNPACAPGFVYQSFHLTVERTTCVQILHENDANSDTAIFTWIPRGIWYGNWVDNYYFLFNDGNYSCLNGFVSKQEDKPWPNPKPTVFGKHVNGDQPLLTCRKGNRLSNDNVVVANVVKNNSTDDISLSVSCPPNYAAAALLGRVDLFTLFNFSFHRRRKGVPLTPPKGLAQLLSQFKDPLKHVKTAGRSLSCAPILFDSAKEQVLETAAVLDTNGNFDCNNGFLSGTQLFASPSNSSNTYYCRTVVPTLVAEVSTNVSNDQFNEPSASNSDSHSSPYGDDNSKSTRTTLGKYVQEVADVYAAAPTIVVHSLVVVLSIAFILTL